MILNRKNQSTFQLIWQEAGFNIDRALRALHAGKVTLVNFDSVYEALQRLPFPQDEFALVMRRLHNAERYCGDGETGAAIYELNLLVGVIRWEVKCATTFRQTTSLY